MNTSTNEYAVIPQLADVKIDALTTDGNNVVMDTEDNMRIVFGGHGFKLTKLKHNGKKAKVWHAQSCITASGDGLASELTIWLHADGGNITLKWVTHSGEDDFKITAYALD